MPSSMNDSTVQKTGDEATSSSVPWRRNLYHDPSRPSRNKTKLFTSDNFTITSDAGEPHGPVDLFQTQDEYVPNENLNIFDSRRDNEPEVTDIDIPLEELLNFHRLPHRAIFFNQHTGDMILKAPRTEGTASDEEPEIHNSNFADIASRSDMNISCSQIHQENPAPPPSFPRGSYSLDFTNQNPDQNHPDNFMVMNSIEEFSIQMNNKLDSKAKGDTFFQDKLGTLLDFRLQNLDGNMNRTSKVISEFETKITESIEKVSEKVIKNGKKLQHLDDKLNRTSNVISEFGEKVTQKVDKIRKKVIEKDEKVEKVIGLYEKTKINTPESHDKTNDLIIQTNDLISQYQLKNNESFQTLIESTQNIQSLLSQNFPQIFHYLTQLSTLLQTQENELRKQIPVFFHTLKKEFKEQNDQILRNSIENKLKTHLINLQLKQQESITTLNKTSVSLDQVNQNINVGFQQLSHKLNNNIAVQKVEKFHNFKSLLKDIKEEIKITETLVEQEANETCNKIIAIKDEILDTLQTELVPRTIEMANQFPIIDNNIRITDERNENRKNEIIKLYEEMFEEAKQSKREIMIRFKKVKKNINLRIKENANTHIQVTGEMMYSTSKVLKEAASSFTETITRKETDITNSITEIKDMLVDNNNASGEKLDVISNKLSSTEHLIKRSITKSENLQAMAHTDLLAQSSKELTLLEQTKKNSDLAFAQLKALPSRIDGIKTDLIQVNSNQTFQLQEFIKENLNHLN